MSLALSKLLLKGTSNVSWELRMSLMEGFQVGPVLSELRGADEESATAR